MKEISLTLLITVVISSGLTSTSYDHLCLKLNGDYVKHPQDCNKFIQCSHHKAYEFQCPGNLLWHHEIKSCDYPNRTPCERVGDKRKKQKLDEIKENVKNLTLEEKIEKRLKINCPGIKHNVNATTQTLLKASNKTLTNLDCKSQIHNSAINSTTILAKFSNNQQIFTENEKTTKQLTDKDNFNEKLPENNLKLADEENVDIKLNGKENEVEIKQLKKGNSLAKLTDKENSIEILPNKENGTRKCKDKMKTTVKLKDKHKTTVKLTDKDKRTEKQLNKGNSLAKLTVKENSTTDKENTTVKLINKNNSAIKLSNTTEKLTGKEITTIKSQSNSTGKIPVNNNNLTVKLTEQDNITTNSANKENISVILLDKDLHSNVKLTDNNYTTKNLPNETNTFTKLTDKENTTVNLTVKYSGKKKIYNNNLSSKTPIKAKESNTLKNSINLTPIHTVKITEEEKENKKVNTVKYIKTKLSHNNNFLNELKENSTNSLDTTVILTELLTENLSTGSHSSNSTTEKEIFFNSTENSKEKDKMLSKEKIFEENFNFTGNSATVKVAEKENNIATTERSILNEISTIWEKETTVKTQEHKTSADDEKILRETSIKRTTEKENLHNSNDNFMENQNSRIILKEITEFKENVNTNTATNIFTNKITEKEHYLLTTTKTSFHNDEQENPIVLSQITGYKISNNTMNLTETVSVNITVEENTLPSNTNISLVTLGLTTPFNGTKEMFTNSPEMLTVKVTEEEHDQYNTTTKLDEKYVYSLNNMKNATINVKNTLKDLPESSMLITEKPKNITVNLSKEIQNSTIFKKDNNANSLSELLKEFSELPTKIPENFSIFNKVTENVTVKTIEEDNVLNQTTDPYTIKLTKDLTETESTLINSFKNSTKMDDNVNLTELITEKEFNLTEIFEDSMELFSQVQISNNLPENSTETSTINNLQDTTVNLTELEMKTLTTELNFTESSIKKSTLKNFTENVNNVLKNITAIRVNVNLTELKRETLTTETMLTDIVQNLNKFSKLKENSTEISNSNILENVNENLTDLLIDLPITETTITEIYVNVNLKEHESETLITDTALTAFSQNLNNLLNSKENLTAYSQIETVNVTELDKKTSTEMPLKFSAVNLTNPEMNVNNGSTTLTEETTIKENNVYEEILTEFPHNDSGNLTELKKETPTEIPLKLGTGNLRESEMKDNNSDIIKTFNSLSEETTNKENNFNDDLRKEEMEKTITVNLTAKEKEADDTTEEISTINAKSTKLAMDVDEAISIDYTTTTLAPDNMAEDPRLPFRSAKCKGLNNRLQFEAPKCYQYYQCFAGWAFLLNCHEGWSFESQNGRCILDENKKCKL